MAEAPTTRLTTDHTEDRFVAAQAGYYTVTGIWPLVNPSSFQAVTGPKTDMWLVKTFGVLVTVVGGTLAAALLANRVTSEIRGLAMGSALALAAADINYVAKGRISRSYLVDAAINLGLCAWGLAGRRRLDTAP